jgi:hypothetical protein
MDIVIKEVFIFRGEEGVKALKGFRFRGIVVKVVREFDIRAEVFREARG